MRTLLVVAAALPCSLFACARPPAIERNPAAALYPVVRVRNADYLRIPVAIHNRSSAPFRCAAKNGRELTLAIGVLYQQGEEITSAIRRNGDESRLTASDVAIVQPGEVKVLDFQLRYSDLTPGVYELRLSYLCGSGTPPGGPQLTPAAFELRYILELTPAD